MPRFDFQCSACKTIFEEALPFGSIKKPPCPACGSKATEKLIGAPGIVFKGSGWYKTDSRPTPPPPKKEENPTPPEAPRGAATSKSDTTSKQIKEPKKEEKKQ